MTRGKSLKKKWRRGQDSNLHDLSVGGFQDRCTTNYATPPQPLPKLYRTWFGWQTALRSRLSFCVSRRVQTQLFSLQPSRSP